MTKEQIASIVALCVGYVAFWVRKIPFVGAGMAAGIIAMELVIVEFIWATLQKLGSKAAPKNATEAMAMCEPQMMGSPPPGL